MKKFANICIILFYASLMCINVFAIDSKTQNRENNEDLNFNVNITAWVYAEQDNSPSYSGNATGHKVTDTRTEEQKTEDAKVAERDELEKKIQEIANQIANGKAGQETWNQLPNIGDWVNQNDGGLDNSGNNLGTVGTVDIPEWALPENPTLSTNPLPSMEELWNQFLIEYHIIDFDPIDPTTITIPGLSTIIPGVEITPELILVTGLENPNPTFEETYIKETTNGLMTVSQQTVPIGTLATYAGINAGLKLENQAATQVPITIPEIEITIRDEQTIIVPGISFPSSIIPDITTLPVDFSNWIDEFTNWLLDKYPIKPGEASDIIEDQFTEYPTISDVTENFPGTILPGTLPGTDIDIGFAANQQALYDLLFLYMQQLAELNMTNVNVTKYTIYQITDYDIQTIHTSIPTSEYQWVVNGPGGSVDKTTNTPYAKLLFRSEGIYDVDIYNTQNVYRNNKVTGEKSDIWVLSNGGYFDGLIVYQSTSSFSGYVSEDIGPTLEQVRLVDESFTATVSPSMLNIITIMDQYGNLRKPADGFTTERN